LNQYVVGVTGNCLTNLLVWKEGRCSIVLVLKQEDWINVLVYKAA